MRRLLLVPFIVIGLLGAVPAASTTGSFGNGGSHSSHAKGTSKKSSTKKSSTPRSSTKKTPTTTRRESTIKQPPGAVARDSHGRIRRSEEAKVQFMRQTGFPHGRPGWVVDHKITLACGGVDAPSNMQWQTIAEARAKDKIDRRGCR